MNALMVQRQTICDVNLTAQNLSKFSLQTKICFVHFGCYCNFGSSITFHQTLWWNLLALLFTNIVEKFKTFALFDKMLFVFSY